MNQQSISPLRQRIIEDMNVRNFVEKTGPRKAVKVLTWADIVVARADDGAIGADALTG
jgi:hypothetical protein